MGRIHRSDIRLLIALVLSIALHGALVSIRAISLRAPARSAQALEVRFAYPGVTADAVQSAMRADASPVRSHSTDGITNISAPQAPEKAESTGISDAPDAPRPAETPYIAIPLPSSIATPFGSSSARSQGNTWGAAYVAQRQHQALLDQQMLAAAARGQYELRLMEYLHRQQVSGSCSIVLAKDGELDTRCHEVSDAAAIAAALAELGRAPPAPRSDTRLIVELAPGHSGQPPEFITRRVEDDPGR